MKDIFSKDILLGHNLDGQEIYLDPEIRKEHMHVMGTTGEGKSKFIEHLIQQDIINGDGICLIDPHGSLYDNIVKWITLNQYDLKGRNFIFLNPAEDEYTFNFNPLRERKGSDISFVISRMIDGCAKVWGAENTDQTPLLERCLRGLLYALSANNLPLSDSEHIIKPRIKEIRKYITDNIDKNLYKREWEYFNGLKTEKFEDIFMSTINRLLRFLDNDFIKSILGQTVQAIDFYKIMEEGAVVLVNLNDKGKYDTNNARLLGTLLINDMLVCAKARKPDVSRPFYLYIDECANYLNGDITSILTECRKFGLHLILVHQFLYQLMEAGENIYHAVMNTAKTKVVFATITPKDALEMAELVFMGELDLAEPIHILDKPVVVGYERIMLKGWSHSRGTSYGGSESESSGSGSSRSSSQTTTQPQDAPWLYNPTVSDMTGASNSFSSSQSSGSSWSESESNTESESEALIPILEIRPSAVESIENQRYKKTTIVANMPKQYAIMKLPKQRSQITKVPTIENYINDPELDEIVNKFTQEVYRASGMIRARQEVIKEIKDREQALYELARPKPKEDPTDFKAYGRPDEKHREEEQAEEIGDYIKGPRGKKKAKSF